MARLWRPWLLAGVFMALVAIAAPAGFAVEASSTTLSVSGMT